MPESSSDLTRSLDRLNASIDQLRTELVRKDVYDAQRAADKELVREIRDDVAEIRANDKWRVRTFIVALLVPLLNSVVLLWLTQQVVNK